MNITDLARECDRRLAAIDAAIAHLEAERPITAYESLKDARRTMIRVAEEQTAPKP